MKTLVFLTLIILSVFSQNNPVDYWVDLTNGNSYVSIGACDYGHDGQLSVSFVTKIGTLDGWKQIFHSFNDLNNDGADPLRLGVAINNGNVFGLHIGTAFYSWNIAAMAAGAEYAYTVDLVNSGTNVHVSVIRNGASILDVVVAGNVGAGVRVMTIIGAYRYSSGALVNLLSGSSAFLDNFIILTKVSTATFRGSLFNPLWKPTVDVAGDIRLWLSFDDTVSGVGTKTIAVTAINGPESFWVDAEFINGAIFKQHTPEGWINCGGSGDPHIYMFNGLGHWDGGEHMDGHYLMVGCDEADYEVRTFARYTQWWGATVYRSVAVRFRDNVFRYNLDEVSGYGGGNPLGVPAGAYMKSLHETAWTALGGSGWRLVNNMYYYYSGNSFQVSVPLVGSLSLSDNGRYMDISVSFNSLLTGCARSNTPAIDGRGKEGREGYCDGDGLIWRWVDYSDWLPPPPLQDINIPTDPCFDLDVGIVNSIQAQCRRIYPTNNDLYTDCRMDGCLSGDPEIIPFTTPKPECQYERLTGKPAAASCDELVCPNFCSYRGTCDKNTGLCACDAGFVGKDCGQAKLFGCQSFKFSDIETYVTPLTLINTKIGTFGGANLLNQFNSLGVERSVLFYSVKLDSMYYLFAVASNTKSPYPGSFNLCFDAPITVNQNVNIQVGSAGANCYSISFREYEQGGIIFELGNGPTAHNYLVTVTLKNQIDQVLFGSANGVREIDIAKIPEAFHATGFNYKVASCDSEVCTQYTNCKTCSDQPQCGYCLETNRCMLGTASGPYTGVCRNWRFTFDDAISRVVTLDYTGADLVDPDYEIFLSAGSADDVSVSLFVPTGNANTQWDVVVYFQTTGTYPVYASSIKTNFMNTIESKSIYTKNLNLAIGVYDEGRSILTQSLTRVALNNHYIFARALESVDNSGKNLNGGQIHALGTIGGANGVNVGFRKYSKKLAVLTVYDIPTAADAAKLQATKQALVKNNVLPVFFIMGDANVENYYRTTLANDKDGFPSVIIKVDESGSQFKQAFERMFLLGSSLPYIALDNVNDDLVHLDQTSLASRRDILYISGLTHPNTRARFILPMLRGDGNHHTAKIRVPGYGDASIVDVDNGIPSASHMTITGNENEPCINVILKGYTFKNLLPPFYNIRTLPGKGTLFFFDSTKQGANGAAVTAGYHLKNSLCFRPPAHDYSFPLKSVYASFTYSVSDGCAESPVYTVDLIVTPVLEPPVSQNYVINLFEGDNSHNFTITAFEYDKDLTTNVDEKVSFKYKFLQSFIRPDLFSKVDTSMSIRERATGNPVSYTTPYGPLTTTNNQVSQDLTYIYPSDDFFGIIQNEFTVSDDQNLQSTYKISIHITPINDDPVAIFEPIMATNEDTPITIILQGFDVDNYGPTLTYKIVSIKNAGATIKNTKTGADLAIGTEYSYTEPNSHKVEVPITLNPFKDDNNCPTGTAFQSCPGSYLVIQFKVNDNNKEWQKSKADTTIAAAETGWNQITVHVIAVNDRPVTPADIKIEILEDAPMQTLTLTADDIDTTENLLDVFVEHLPQYKSLHLFQRLAGGAKGTEITSDGTELNDFTKKRFTQNHGLFVLADANVHGTSKSNNFLFDTFTYYSWDDELRSDSAVVRVYIRPVNDEPVPTTSASFLEDNNFTLTFDAADVDNAETDLNYTITALPSLTAIEGVSVWFVDAKGDWKELTTVDLPYTVPRVNGRATVILSPRHNWFGSSKFTFTTTDVDLYLSPGDAGYKVNTPSKDFIITVVPVNDPPVIKVSSPMGKEDSPIIITLSGEDDAWGEHDTLVARLESDLYDGDGKSVTLGALYQYTDALYNALLADINAVSTAVEVKNQTVVTDAQFRIIYVPRQHKNTETTLKHLSINPWFDYRVEETASANDPKLLSSPIGSVKIVVSSVNDLPVAWGNTWSTIAEYEDIYGIKGGKWNDPINSASPSQTDVCYDTCFYWEDFGLKYPATPAHRGIFFGGQDIELSDLSIKIIDAVCPDNVEFFYTESDGTEVKLKTSELKGWTYTQNIAPGALRSILQFRPALDDFNLDNPSEQRSQPTEGGHKGAYFCTIEYEVIDQDGGVSQNTKTIHINVMQKNDIPREKIVRPQDNNNNALFDVNNFVVNQVIGFEDGAVIFKLDAYDVEGDDFNVKIFDCEDGKGTFYGPSDKQTSLINANGGLDLPTTNPIQEAFSLVPINCSVAKKSMVTLTQSFVQTGKKGWFLLFIPNPNENGVNYNKLSLIYDDGISPVDAIYGTFRFFTILPVNDAPEIWINSPQNGSSVPISYDQNLIILNPLDFKGDVHVDGSENLGTIIGSSFNFGLMFKDVDALDAVNLDYEISITKRPKKRRRR